MDDSCDSNSQYIFSNLSVGTSFNSDSDNPLPGSQLRMSCERCVAYFTKVLVLATHVRGNSSLFSMFT